MKKQLLLLVAIMVGSSSLIAQTWTSTTSTAWEEAANWDGGAVPTDGSEIKLKGSSVDIAICELNSEYTSDKLKVGNLAAGSPVKLVVNNGAKLTVGGSWGSIGEYAEGQLDVMLGGSVVVVGHLWLVKQEGSKTVINVAGTLEVLRNWGFDWYGKSTNGSGIVTVQDTGVFSVSKMDVKEGVEKNAFQGTPEQYKVNIEGNGQFILTKKDIAFDDSDPENIIQAEDWTGKVQHYIDSGHIVADGGANTVVVTELNDVIYMTSSAGAAPVLNVENNATLDFSVYPNPATDNITIASKTSISNVQLFNSVGQQVLSVDGVSSVDISGLATGFYVLKATDAEGNVGVQRVIKE